LIGSGGILTAEDAIEFFIAGASAVQIGTANLIDPAAPARITAGISDYLSRAGFNDIRELIGSLKS
jgi:dihydroorotate dehydrogenase (NAD+) catalytic subunit